MKQKTNTISRAARWFVTLLAVMLTTATAWAETRYNLEVCEGGFGLIHVKGWAYRLGAETVANACFVRVDVYSDKDCTSQYGESHTIEANLSRPDVNQEEFIVGDHGFEASIPIADTGTYYVKVYAQESFGGSYLMNGPHTQVIVTGPVTLSGNQSYTAQDGDVLTGSTAGTVTIADGASVTLSDVTINGGIVCDGSATITLEGTNSVTGISNEGEHTFTAGIQVGGNGTTLIIRGDGSLTATGGFSSAGIGTSFSFSSDVTGGDIIIEGGNIIAIGTEESMYPSSHYSKASFGSAGIGTGAVYQLQKSSIGTITIKGGTVTATGYNGIGIGYSIDNYTEFGTYVVGKVTIYDTIDQVDASSISRAVTYMHGETDVTANAGDYFTINGGNITLRHRPITYINAVDGEDGVTNTNPTAYTFYTPTFTLTDPTRTGYTFAGWYSDEELNTPATTTITQGTMEDKTFYAAWTAQTVVLADGTAYDRTADIAVPSATYSKTIGTEQVGKYQAWLLPFDYTIAETDLQKFSFYKINTIVNALSGSGNATDQPMVLLSKLSAGSVLRANTPYVYKPLEAVTNYAFTAVNATLTTMNTDVALKTETAEDCYAFYATYENTTATAAAPFYYVDGDGIVSYGNDATVGSYRWVIRKTDKNGDTPATAPQMRFIDGEGLTIGVRGDANGDGSVSVTDIGVIVDIILGINNNNARKASPLAPSIPSGARPPRSLPQGKGCKYTGGAVESEIIPVKVFSLLSPLNR